MVTPASLEEHQTVSTPVPEVATLPISPVSFWVPKHMVTPASAWLEHGPFAFWLTEAVRPGTFVELGTHSGFSYLTFCQAVERLGLSTSCNAIDTWLGDAHTGLYGEDVFAALNATNEQHYAAFSRLIRSHFDGALPTFPDGSIDLLHIDGRHAYEDVVHDYHSWRPKMSERGVVLFHDTNERNHGFGVWRLWQELAEAHPSFEFLHGHGLGILAPGRIVPEGIRQLFRSGYGTKAATRDAYARLGAAVSSQYQLDHAQACTEAHDRQQARLKLAEQQRDAALADCEAILNSTLWRVTLPLRVARSAVPASIRHTALRPLRVGYQIISRRLARQIGGGRTTSVAADARSEQAASFNPLAEAESQTVTYRDYKSWVRDCDTLTAQDRAAIVAHIDRLTHLPLISVIMPAYETPMDLLREAIGSVRAQLYPNWELCIADDVSASDGVATVLREAAEADPQIKWIRRGLHGHIAAATNSALELATGEFVTFMDHDDRLSERALYEIAAALDAHPDVAMLFSDEDQIDVTGHRCCPYFKPDWNVELMLGHNMINHLCAYRRALVDQIGGMRLGFDGSEDYDLALRAVAATDAARIRHIPAILYHRRQHGASSSTTDKPACVDAARRAIADFLASQGVIGAAVEPAPGMPAWSRVHWPLLEPLPKVSVIIPTRDRPDLLARSATAVLFRTDYPNLELIIADNDSREPEALFLLGKLAEDPRVCVLPSPGPFNYAAINNAAARVATGDVLILLNSDIDTIHIGWLREMVALAIRPGIGAVGAKLRYGNDTIQHAGVVLGLGRFENGLCVAGHYGQGLPATNIGSNGCLILAREVTAVTGACLAVRKSVYEIVNGLDEVNLPVSLNDIDFCLRLRDVGLRNLWTPFAEMYHMESASRGSDKVERINRETNYMRQRWGAVLDNDPFYNANFSRDFPPFQLAIPARRLKPWQEYA